MIGEIGGSAEEEAEFLKEKSKPMVGFIAGLTAPPEKDGTCWSDHFRWKRGAQDKIEIMKSAGITISRSPADIGKTLYQKLNS